MSDSRGTAIKFANTAWDNHEQPTKRDWPTSLDGLSKAELAALNKQRKAWNQDLPVIMTEDMKDIHRQLHRVVASTGTTTQRWFGLQGDANLGKSQILKHFVDQYHCEHTDQRPIHPGLKHEPVPVVWLQTPNTFNRLLLSFMSYYGADVRGRGEKDKLVIDSIANLAERHGTRIVVLDDLHMLGNAGGSAASQVKFLSERIEGALFLCTINTGAKKKPAVFDPERGGDQIRTRGDWPQIKPFKATSTDWKKALAKFESRMPWCTSNKAQTKPHATLLHELCEGRTGTLAKLLKDITSEMILSNTSGEDLLTEQLIRLVAEGKRHAEAA